MDELKEFLLSIPVSWPLIVGSGITVSVMAVIFKASSVCREEQGE